MNISEKLTQEKLHEILIDIVMKGNDTKDIEVSELVEDIKQQVLRSII